MAEQNLLDEAKRFGTALFGCLAAAVGVRIGRVKYSGEQGTESFPLYALARGQRQRSHGAAMKTAVECDEFVAARRVARKLNRRFHRLRARISEIDPARL